MSVIVAAADFLASSALPQGLPSPSTKGPRPVEESQSFAVAVMDARKKRQMSTGALAEQSGVSLQVVEDLERGYPVAQQVVAAICRNLDLAEPQLDHNPLVRLALLLRERRGRARLSRSQLGEKAGVVAKTIKSIETASHWPSQETCMGLLAVKALQLQWQDVTAFVSPPASAVADGFSPAQSGESFPSATAAPDAATAPPALRTGPATGLQGSEAGAPPQSPARTGPKPAVTVRVRVYADGKVSIAVRPS